MRRRIRLRRNKFFFLEFLSDVCYNLRSCVEGTQRSDLRMHRGVNPKEKTPVLTFSICVKGINQTKGGIGNAGKKGKKRISG